jgi:hypothetical protein
MFDSKPKEPTSDDIIFNVRNLNNDHNLRGAKSYRRAEKQKHLQYSEKDPLRNLRNGAIMSSVDSVALQQAASHTKRYTSSKLSL